MHNFVCFSFRTCYCELNNLLLYSSSLIVGIWCPSFSFGMWKFHQLTVPPDRWTWFIKLTMRKGFNFRIQESTHSQMCWLDSGLKLSDIIVILCSWITVEADGKSIQHLNGCSQFEQVGTWSELLSCACQVDINQG